VGTSSVTKSTWHHRDGSESTYENPQRGEHRPQLWSNPNGAYFWLSRAYPLIITGSILNVAGEVRGEAELLIAGWRRVVA
jgi:hypothetical protein